MTEGCLLFFILACLACLAASHEAPHHYKPPKTLVAAAQVLERAEDMGAGVDFTGFTIAENRRETSSYMNKPGKMTEANITIDHEDDDPGIWIASWNLHRQALPKVGYFMHRLLGSEREQRITRIVQQLRQMATEKHEVPSVLMFQELYTKDENLELEKELQSLEPDKKWELVMPQMEPKKVYKSKHWTNILNNGLTIATTLKTKDVVFMDWEEGVGADHLVRKGVMYAKLQPRATSGEPEKTVHLFNLQLQRPADLTMTDADIIRDKQMQQLVGMMREFKFEENDLVVMGGDLKMDCSKHKEVIPGSMDLSLSFLVAEFGEQSRPECDSDLSWCAYKPPYGKGDCHNTDQVFAWRVKKTGPANDPLKLHNIKPGNRKRMQAGPEVAQHELILSRFPAVKL